MAWSEGRRLLGAVIHASSEPSELSQWPCGYDDSTINIVMGITIIIKQAWPLLRTRLRNEDDVKFSTLTFNFNFFCLSFSLVSFLTLSRLGYTALIKKHWAARRTILQYCRDVYVVKSLYKICTIKKDSNLSTHIVSTTPHYLIYFSHNAANKTFGCFCQYCLSRPLAVKLLMSSLHRYPADLEIC